MFDKNYQTFRYRSPINIENSDKNSETELYELDRAAREVYWKTVRRNFLKSDFFLLYIR